MSTTLQEPPPSAAADWVPVEDRWFGLDRRSLTPGIFVLIVSAVMIWAVPGINSAISWTDQTRAGDVIDLGSGLRFAPPVGWELTDGIRTTDQVGLPPTLSNSTASLQNRGVEIKVTAQTYDGSAAALLARLNTTLSANQGAAFRVTGARSSITTDDGRTGVSESYTGPVASGRLVAFVLPKGAIKDVTSNVGLTFEISGPEGSLAAVSSDVDAMLASVTVVAS